MAGPIKLKFVLSGDSVERLPDVGPEVCFVGRSNVGKSSLINAVSNRKKLAHVSNTPGRTRLLNLFEFDPRPGGLMDLPGYGFAAAPAQMRGSWQKMIEGYLLERESLVMVLVLVDGVVGPTKLDLQMLDWLRSVDLPHTVVATKHDKVKSSLRDKRKKEVAKKCQLEPDDVVWVSAVKGVGIDRLRGMIRRWVSFG